MKHYDLIVVGSGAAGLAAAVYAGRYKLSTLVVEGEFGGETATAGVIENYPGIPAIEGYELMRSMKKQAQGTGAVFLDAWVKEIIQEGKCFVVKTEKEEIRSTMVVLGIGSQRRHLNLPNEKELTGRGIHYCWTCDGPLYGGKVVAMIGGGDSSVKGVNFLAEYAEKIFLLYRDTDVRAEPINFERMQKLGDKVVLLPKTEVKEIVGEKKLEKIVLSQEYNGSFELPVDALFVEIGFDPDQTFVKQLGLETDERGYVKTDAHMNTNVPGLFVAGDMTNHFGGFKQDITAAALGSVAATSAYEYKKNNPDICVSHDKPS
ncbi:MAG: FAD-dependent oxidoreductase [bacterium]|nr:FAD-dependent oxidoreductase [bacterium]